MTDRIKQDEIAVLSTYTSHEAKLKVFASLFACLEMPFSFLLLK